MPFSGVRYTLVVLFFSVFLSKHAFAAYSNYNSILIGDQAAGMGGSYTAMYGDPAGGPFYNPASLAWLEGSSFSSAVGIYKKFDTHYGDYEDFTKAGLRVNQGFFRSLPSSTGSVVKYKDWAVAMSIVVPWYENFKGDLKNTENVVSSLTFVDESLWVGGALSKKISKTESAGLTMYYTARNYQRTIVDKSLDDPQDQEIFTEEKAFTQNAIVAIFGYQKNITEKLRMGLSWRAPSYPIAGEGSFFRTIVKQGDIQSDVANSGSMEAKGPVPSKVTFGLAYVEPNKFKASGDFSVYGNENYTDLENERVGTLIVNRNIWNGSLGVEVMIRPWVRARLGAYTNFSSHPDLTLDNPQDQATKIDQLGWSANVAFTSNKITYTFGGYYTGGRGKSMQYIDQTREIVNVTQQVFTMLVGTNYYF